MRILEETWRSLVENAPNIITIIDRKEKVQYINRTISGINTKDVIGRDICDYIQPEYHEMVKKIIRKVFETGEHGSYVIRAVDTSGRISWFETKVGPIKQGVQIDAVSLISTNITERKIVEQGLKESEENFRNITKNANDCIIIAKGKSKIAYANGRASEVTGYSVDELLKLNIMQLMHPDETDKVMEIFKKRIESKSTPQNYDTILLRKDGASVYVELNTAKTVWMGEPADLAIIRDITERKKTEGKLIESEEMYKDLSEQLQIILDNIPLAIFLLDLKGNFLQVNKYLTEALNTTKKNMISKNAHDFFPKAQAESHRRMDLKAMKNKKIVEYIDALDTQYGKRWGLNTKIPLIDKKSNVYSILGIAQDITKIKNVEQKLKKALNRAEFYKDLFAHDINNLLQGILSSNELLELLLKDAELTPQINKALSIINEQIDRGSKLVYNVRKLSQIEEQEIKLEKIEIVRILKKTIEYVKDSFHDKPINISLGLFSEEIYINGNELIEDVFENLLINAVKHNNNPTVDLIVRISKENIDGLSKYKFEFIDNGKGIEDRRKSLIFQRVERDAKSVTGMGLGLSLVKKIIDTYEGEIWVENRKKNDYSKGSAFNILLPED